MHVDPTTIIRAWRDPKFAASLPDDVRSRIPANPAGERPNATADAKDAAVGPQGTYTAECATYTSSCATYTSDCGTYTSACGTYTSSCATYTSSCGTYTSSCATYTSNCDTRITCTKVTGCK